MEKTYKKNSGRIFLFALAFLFIVLGCSGLKKVSEDTGIRVKGGKEILVARDVTNVPPFWCGQGTALVYSTENRGIFWHDIETGRKIHVAEQTVMPLQCSPDGKWLLYVDKDSLRMEEKVGGENKEISEGDVVSLLRYELSTGRRQVFAEAYDTFVSSGKSILSPDGKKVFLGKRTKKTIEMPEPKWETIWSEKGDISSPLWLSDSSAVVINHGGHRRDRNPDFLVEVLEPVRKTVLFNPTDLGSFVLLFVDRQDRFYMKAMSGHKLGPDITESILRCTIDIEGGKVSCDTVLEGDVDGRDAFSDGETIAYMMEHDTCVRVMKIGEEDGHCITTGQYKTDFYTVISSDEKWVAFTAGRKRENNSFAQDLYVVELKVRR